MCEFIVKWDVNVSDGIENITLENMGLTEDEWDSLDDDEKDLKMQEALDNLPDRVNIILRSWRKVD